MKRLDENEMILLVQTKSTDHKVDAILTKHFHAYEDIINKSDFDTLKSYYHRVT